MCYFRVKHLMFFGQQKVEQVIHNFLSHLEWQADSPVKQGSCRGSVYWHGKNTINWHILRILLKIKYSLPACAVKPGAFYVQNFDGYDSGADSLHATRAKRSPRNPFENTGSFHLYRLTAAKIKRS